MEEVGKLQQDYSELRKRFDTAQAPSTKEAARIRNDAKKLKKRIFNFLHEISRSGQGITEEGMNRLRLVRNNINDCEYIFNEMKERWKIQKDVEKVRKEYERVIPKESKGLFGIVKPGAAPKELPLRIKAQIDILMQKRHITGEQKLILERMR